MINGPDPQWYERQQQRWMQMIQLVMQANDRKQRREDAEFQNAIKVMADTPEIAQGGYGDEILKRWTKKRPEVVPFVEAIRNRALLGQQMMDARVSYENLVAGEMQMDQQRIAEIQEASQYPAQFGPTLPLKVPGAAGGIPNPGWYAQMAQHQMMYQPPPEARAWMMMPPAQRAALATNMKIPDYTPPTEKYSPKIRAAAATSIGDPGRFREAVDIEAGLGRSADSLAQDARQEASFEQQEAMEGLRQKNRLASEDYKHAKRIEMELAKGTILPVTDEKGRVRGYAPSPKASKQGQGDLSGAEKAAAAFIQSGFTPRAAYSVTTGTDASLSPDGKIYDPQVTKEKDLSMPALDAWRQRRDAYHQRLTGKPNADIAFEKWIAENPPPNPTFMTKSAMDKLAALAARYAAFENEIRIAKGREDLLTVEEVAQYLTTEFLRMRTGYTEFHRGLKKQQMTPKSEDEAIRLLVNANLNP